MQGTKKRPVKQCVGSGQGALRSCPTLSKLSQSFCISFVSKLLMLLFKLLSLCGETNRPAARGSLFKISHQVLLFQTPRNRGHRGDSATPSDSLLFKKLPILGSAWQYCETWTCLSFLLPVPGLSKDPFRLLIRPDFTSVLLSCGRQRIDHHRVIDMSHMTIISIMSQWATLNMAHTYSTHGHETHSKPCHCSLSVAAPQ